MLPKHQRITGSAFYFHGVITVLLSTWLSSSAYGDTNLAKPRPIVIAHRGASGYLPEHTEGAKVLAIAQGADYVEQDVVLSRDRVVVVSHDITLNETTNVADRFPDRRRADGKFYFADFDWSELRRLSVHERSLHRVHGAARGIRFPNAIDQRLMTLEDEIRLVQGLNQTLGRKVGIYVELKAPSWHKQHFGAHMADGVLKLLTQFGYFRKEDLCFLQCFEAEELKYVRNELRCQLRLIQLIGNKPLGLTPENAPPTNSSDVDMSELLKSEMSEIAKFADGIGPPLALVARRSNGAVASTGIVESAHQGGVQVHPYTVRVDALPDWAKTIDELHHILIGELKTDGFFTDFPDIGRQAIERTFR